jgi:hypothetical protein
MTAMSKVARSLHARFIAALGLLLLAAASAATEKPADVAGVIPLINAGFESDKKSSHGGPEAWSGTQHAGEVSYRFTLDSETRRSGKRSMRIENVGKEPFGAFEQSLSVAPHAGRKLRFSGWLKTDGANAGGAVLVMVAEHSSGGIVAHNFMAGSEVKGTRDWQRYSIVLSIPAYASGLRVGVMLLGAGTVWFDDAELEVLAS